MQGAAVKVSIVTDVNNGNKKGGIIDETQHLHCMLSRKFPLNQTKYLGEKHHE
jgi:hypothetical protein